MIPESRKWKSRENDSDTAGADKRELNPSTLSETADVPVTTIVAHDEARRDTNDWIAEVSHELRLPIANLKLLVETLLDGALEDEVTARRMLTRAKTEVERLQSLVLNLLSAEQMANTRKDVHRTKNLLQPRVVYALETVRKLAAEKSIDISCEIVQHHHVFANLEMLDQVLLNLLENAVKFTPEGGKIIIKSGARDGEFVITDTGIGMAQTEIPKIFQRFYRVDRARSRGSTGLGLSIVKHILELHDAKINVKSQEGKGSTFELSFPNPD
jgi:signal transduction histidine kinase